MKDYVRDMRDGGRKYLMRIVVMTTSDYSSMVLPLYTPSYRKVSMRDMPTWVECLELVSITLYILPKKVNRLN